MEEEKAAAYYDELTRKGEGAARFKQGLGFTSHSSDTTTRASALPSSSSFLSNFVRASSPEKSSSDLQKQSQIETIQNKLKKKPTSSDNQSRVSNDHSSRDSRSKRRSSSRDRERDRRSRSRDGRGSRHRYRSSSRERERRSEGSVDRKRRRGRSRSLSPRDRRSDKSRGASKVGKERNGGIEYSRVIKGYDKMSPAERIKAKMKLQLSETAEKDAGMGSGWERFEFNKDAPLDDDEEIEAAEDDAVLVKHMGQSFRFSAVEARREEEIKAAHDEAMFGASALPPSIVSDNEREGEINKKESSESGLATSLISDKVLAKQQGSWRDRARRV